MMAIGLLRLPRAGRTPGGFDSTTSIFENDPARPYAPGVFFPEGVLARGPLAVPDSMPGQLTVEYCRIKLQILIGKMTGRRDMGNDASSINARSWKISR